MPCNSLCNCTGVDLFCHHRGHAYRVRVQRRVDRCSGQRCYLGSDRFEGLDRESKDGGDAAGCGGRGRGERRGRIHTRGRVRHGRKGGSEAEYGRRFFIREPIFGSDKGRPDQHLSKTGFRGSLDVHAQHLGPFSWPEKVHSSTIAFGEWHWIRNQ